jgi:general secretion pathway protein A
LQIVLVGQPELDDKLDSAKLTQLKQRIAIRSHLEPLDHEDTRGYIESRLRLVGANSHAEILFPTKTIAAVYRHSRGIPRLINTICENALLSCYAKQLPSVTPEIIDEVARDFLLNLVRPAEDEKGNVGEMDLQRAAKLLLDLYGSTQKTLTRDLDSLPLATRVRQA